MRQRNTGRAKERRIYFMIYQKYTLIFNNIFLSSSFPTSACLTDQPVAICRFEYFTYVLIITQQIYSSRIRGLVWPQIHTVHDYTGTNPPWWERVVPAISTIIVDVLSVECYFHIVTTKNIGLKLYHDITLTVSDWSVIRYSSVIRSDSCPTLQSVTITPGIKNHQIFIEI